MAEAPWTPKRVAARLEEAADTLRRLPPVRVQGYASNWPPIVRDAHEAYGWDETRVRLGPPAPDAIDRMDEALVWLRWLEPDEVRLVWLRAERVRWKLVAHRLRADRSTAWRWWLCALAKIAGRLNGAESALAASPRHRLRGRKRLNR